MFPQICSGNQKIVAKKLKQPSNKLPFADFCYNYHKEKKLLKTCSLPTQKHKLKQIQKPGSKQMKSFLIPTNIIKMIPQIGLDYKQHSTHCGQ